MGKHIEIIPKFNKDDYVINRASGNMGIIKGVTKKGYYQFKAYYSKMFDEFNDVKNLNYDLQINYQEFMDFCTDEEKQNLDKLMKEKGWKC